MTLRVVAPPFDPDDPGPDLDDVPAIRGPWLRSTSDQEVGKELLRQLRAESGADVVFCEGKMWRYTTDGVWVAIPDEALRNQICAWDGVFLLGDDGKPKLKKDGTLATFTANQRSAKAALERAIDLTSSEGFFDDAPAGVMFSDAFVRVTDVGEVQRLEPSPSHRARFRIDVPFPTNDFVVPEDYVELMFRAFGADDSDALKKIALIQEWFGLAMIGKSPNGRALMLVGPERSGKSATAKIALGVFPASVRASIPIKALDPAGSGGSSAQYYLAQIAGVRINADLDLPAGVFVNGENFKKLVTGEGMTGRHPAGRPFNFTPRVSMLFAGESLPSPEDKNRGFFRRWLVVRYNRQVDASAVIQDYETKVLAKERGQIAAWFIRGAAAALARGQFDIPDSVAEEIPRWVVDADPTAQFCALCTPAPNMPRMSWQPSAYFHQKYSEWCKSSGYFPKAINTFGRELKRNFAPELGYETRNKSMRWAYRYEPDLAERELEKW